MDFEDIFNMDWVSSSEEVPQDYSYIEPIVQEEKETMPSLDQIKHLIEIAKQQIALKEQEMQTAIPSVIFAPPPIHNTTTNTPGIFTTATPPATPPMTAPIINEDTSSVQSSDDYKHDTNSVRDESHEEVTTLEAYAAADGIDLKKLSSKERRQLRNKLSARNFRVRRKEYITSLEEQVADHKRAADQLRNRLSSVEDENKILRKEMDILKRQQQVQSPRILSTINKDISLLGTKPYHQQQDHSILVSNAIMPAWDLNTILNQPKDTSLKVLAGHFLLFVVQLIQEQPSVHKKSLEDLYDILIQDSLMNNSNLDSSFLWSEINSL